MNTICLLPENDIFWANQGSSPDSIVFPIRDRRHGASSQVLRDEHFCKKSSCNVAPIFTHCQWKKNTRGKKHSGNECVVFEIEAYTNFKFQLWMWNSCHKTNSGDLPSFCNLHQANCFWMQFYARPYSPRSSPNQTPRAISWYSKTTTSNGRMGRFKN